MPTIPFVRFCLPDGRVEHTGVVVEDKMFKIYEVIAALGLRMTVEQLRTGEISMCIEDPLLGDFDCIVCQDGPEVVESLYKMLERFNSLSNPTDTVSQWRHDVDMDPEE